MTKTIIGSSMTIEGEIDGDDSLVVLGSVKGKIAVEKSVVVERGAQVDADVNTETLQVAGRLAGKVNARTRVEITPEGRVTGDIRAPRISIADGAQFKGNIDMD